jgi:hypothetical protein
VATFHFVLKLVAVLVLTGAVVVALALSQDGRRRGEPRSTATGKVLIGMMGDSDTAAYHDSKSFPPGTPQAGGDFHLITFQWPEVLGRIREQQVDLGAWAVWGVPRWMSMARIREAIGLPWRGPQKETHQNNLAWPSGCETLTQGPWRQSQRLVDVMDEQPLRWEQGVVVIRTGINSFGKDEALASLALDPDDPATLATMSACVAQIRAAVDLIHQRHPKTRVVLVGIFNNAHWAPYLPRWQSQKEQRNLDQGLDHFDNALRALAAADPRLAFFDDRAWFARKWGQRNPTNGTPDYHAVHVGSVLSVTNTVGDSPEHATLQNLHAGLAWNLLWTQDLVQLMRTQFGVALDAISDDEVAAFLQARLQEMAQSNAAQR